MLAGLQALPGLQAPADIACSAGRCKHCLRVVLCEPLFLRARNRSISLGEALLATSCSNKRRCKPDEAQDAQHGAPMLKRASVGDLAQAEQTLTKVTKQTDFEGDYLEGSFDGHLSAIAPAPQLGCFMVR